MVNSLLEREKEAMRRGVFPALARVSFCVAVWPTTTDLKSKAVEESCREDCVGEVRVSMPAQPRRRKEKQKKQAARRALRRAEADERECGTTSKIPLRNMRNSKVTGAEGTGN